MQQFHLDETSPSHSEQISLKAQHKVKPWAHHKHTTDQWSTPHLSGEQHCRVVVLRMPLAWWVEKLLPGAEVAQSYTSVAGQLRSSLLVLHHQHLHHHYVHWVLDAGVLVQLGHHGHEGEDIVLQRKAKEQNVSFYLVKLECCVSDFFWGKQFFDTISCLLVMPYKSLFSMCYTEYALFKLNEKDLV